MIRSLRFASTVRPLAAAALIAVAASDPRSVAAAPKRSAAETYLAYVDTIATMQNVNEMKPFMPKAMAQMMGAIPREMQVQMLAEARKDQVLRVKVVGESRFGEDTILQLEGTRKGASVKGWARMILEDGEFKVLKDDWSGGSPPAPPKIPASVGSTGKAVGQFTVKGKTAELKYAFASARPYSFDQTKTEYEVILSDVPWKPDDYNRMDRVKAGTLHYVQITIGPDKGVTGTMLNHREFKGNFLSSAGGQHKFEAEQFGPDVVSGKAYMEAPEEGLGDMYYYAATFKAAIQKPKPPAK